jgi:hypothetical protein
MVTKKTFFGRLIGIGQCHIRGKNLEGLRLFGLGLA